MAVKQRHNPLRRRHYFVPHAAAYAKALAMPPPPAAGDVLKLSSVEVLCCYCQIHGLRVRGWRGDLLVLERGPTVVSGGAADSEVSPLRAFER